MVWVIYDLCVTVRPMGNTGIQFLGVPIAEKITDVGRGLNLRCEC